MIFWSASLAGWLAAYLLGSIPTAYLIGRLYQLDIRNHGSGSVGATNALRVLGKGPALGVLMVDVLKGVAAVILVRWLSAWLFESSISLPVVLDEQVWTPWAASLAAAAALLGHSRSIWLGFGGGKSVATGLGVVLALAWPVAIGALAVFAIALAVTRIVSLGSILAALTAMLLVVILEQPLPYQLVVWAGGVYVVVRHRANAKRLLNGTEPRIGQVAGD
ncbi:MAG: glycerol-3-phosphate 1-O-acyltransferase PlsY [Phenylobacterium sp.]|uniref:glycerol-3-phosphate 1-O-acyltransferase PlsY n=1 Tax=Phenylobacterium sp. TaxID=1871053 RepID=UPI002723DE4F|nr:glycerol-3-phosphate 1-O-acyltransferase PlsY [Phenylobacterium sp.]MDO8408912.1 glycerol-3-phosphate 1-O-acyltransferase PlsY [Phenylobacterium sp.]